MLTSATPLPPLTRHPRRQLDDRLSELLADQSELESRLSALERQRAGLQEELARAKQDHERSATEASRVTRQREALARTAGELEVCVLSEYSGRYDERLTLVADRSWKPSGCDLYRSHKDT